MLTIQFGQCGNQLGHTLFSKISADLHTMRTGVSSKFNKEYTEFVFNKWYKGISKDGRNLVRAILVDTEQKVVNNICSDTTALWMYCPQNLVCQAGGGSANNWAFGYSIKGSELGAATLEATRREVERMDRFEGILSLLSSAGGTGSGVGSCITEQLRDEFPTKTIASAIVLPYASGEVGTQNYNTLLTLAKFYNVADIIFLFENDQIQKICTALLKNLDTKLEDINEIICQKLAAVFQPSTEAHQNLSSLVYQVTPHPQYKLATVRSTPHISTASTVFEMTYKWESLVHHLKQTLRIPTLGSEITDVETKMPTSCASTRTSHAYCQSVSNVLITRGTSMDKDSVLGNELFGRELYAEWVPRSNQFNHQHQPRKLLAQDKFAVLVTNNSQLYRPLDKILERSWNAYTHAAFLHQYKRYGVGEDDFLEAFAKIENVVKVYKELNNEDHKS